MSTWVVFHRLVVTALLAGWIGYERERHGRAAGLRTHILVALGSCLVMLTALDMMESLAGRVQIDPTRMAAQVISGIGFLGAGTILRFRASVRGLTTAASLWAVAGIGLAVGSGFVVGAALTTVLALVVLFGLSRWERRIPKEWYKTLTVETSLSGEELGRIRRVLSEYDVEIRDLGVGTGQEPSVSRLELHVKLASDRDNDAILRDVLKLSGTRLAHWA